MLFVTLFTISRTLKQSINIDNEITDTSKNKYPNLPYFFTVILESSDTCVSFGIPIEVRKFVSDHGQGYFKREKTESNHLKV